MDGSSGAVRRGAVSVLMVPAWRLGYCSKLEKNAVTSVSRSVMSVGPALYVTAETASPGNSEKLRKSAVTAHLSARQSAATTARNGPNQWPILSK